MDGAPTSAGHHPGPMYVEMVIGGVGALFECPNGVMISYTGNDMNVGSDNATHIGG